VRGRDAARLLDRVCANKIGKLTYTAMLNRKGGFESDVTVQRWSDEEFLVVTGSAQPVRDRAWLLRNNNPDEEVTVDDVSAEWSVISVLGPHAKKLLDKTDIGSARLVPAAYVGGPGTEIYVRVEDAPALYDRLCAAGTQLGLRDCGYYALDALRIEAGRRAFGAELFQHLEMDGRGNAARGDDRQSGFLYHFRDGGKIRLGESTAPAGIGVDKASNPEFCHRLS